MKPLRLKPCIHNNGALMALTQGTKPKSIQIIYLQRGEKHILARQKKRPSRVCGQISGPDAAEKKKKLADEKATLAASPYNIIVQNKITLFLRRRRRNEISTAARVHHYSHEIKLFRTGISIVRPAIGAAASDVTSVIVSVPGQLVTSWTWDADQLSSVGICVNAEHKITHNTKFIS
jgi:hypothetical protein